MSSDLSFLGTGWEFPPAFVKQGQNTVRLSTGEDDVNQSLEILLGTVLGERIMQPGYGADMSRLLFEPLNASLSTYIKDLILTAVRKYEGRISVENVFLETVHEEGLLNISLDYRLKAIDSRFNFIYPFYLDRAKSLNT